NVSDSSGFSGSSGSKSRRSSSADAAKVKKKRNGAIGGSEHPPPAPEGTPCTPGKRKALKSRTPKTPSTRKSGSLKCPESAPASSKLERSLSSRVSQKNRPRSLSVGRKSRLRRRNKADDLSAATEHTGENSLHHPLFAYPVSLTTH
ncbi:MAG: hypothetical protein SGILL_008498, partial [Bacillariaceae sp.]